MKKIPIIILHGWGSSSAAWEVTKQLLQKAGYQVFIPDLPGFGKELPPKNAWTVSDYVDFVLKFAQLVKLDKFVLIGHSFGGRIAIKLAAQYPQKVEKLVLTGSPIGERNLAKILVFGLLAKIGKILFIIPPFSLIASLARKFLYFLTLERDYYETNGFKRETFKKIINENLVPFLSKIHLPTLILWGEKDYLVPLRTAKKIKENIEKSKLIIISNASHKLPYEMPEIFVEKVTKFLE